MNVLTEMLTEQSWHQLIKYYEDDNCFGSFEDYQQAIRSKCKEVKGDGRRSFLCRKRTDGCFDEDNISIINVTDGDAWELEKVTKPFFKVAPSSLLEGGSL